MKRATSLQQKLHGFTRNARGNTRKGRKTSKTRKTRGLAGIQCEITGISRKTKKTGLFVSPTLEEKASP